MKSIILLILTILSLNSCSHKKEKKIISKSHKVADSYSQADSELEFENEKITLISIIHGIPKDSVHLILRDYLVKNDLSFDIESKFAEKFIDTISKNRKMSKRKIASIIFNFKYEMLTKDDIEQDIIENNEDFRKDDRESEDQY
jgi:hypothetical protein